MDFNHVCIGDDPHSSITHSLMYGLASARIRRVSNVLYMYVGYGVWGMGCISIRSVGPVVGSHIEDMHCM